MTIKDETQAKQDTSLNGDSSAEAEKGSTSKEPTFTKADLEKAKSDALAAAGRTAKDFERKEAEVKEKAARYEKWEREQAEKEEEAVRDDPKGLSELQRKRNLAKKEQEIKDKEAEVARHEAEVEEELNEGREAKQEILVWTVASENNVDPVILKERCTKYKLTTKEDIEDYAKEHAASLTKQEKKETPSVHVNTRENGGSSTKIGDLPPKERIKAIEELLNQKK